MSLAAKCSRAQANVINREQKLQAEGVETHANCSLPCESNGWSMLRDAAAPEPREENGRDLSFPHNQLSTRDVIVGIEDYHC